MPCPAASSQGCLVGVCGTLEAQEEPPTAPEPAVIDFCQLEKELKEYIIRREVGPSPHPEACIFFFIPVYQVIAFWIVMKCMSWISPSC